MMQGLPKVQRFVAVLWPSFIMAGVATVIFFTAFDPVDILRDAGQPEMTRLEAYSIGFFLFWALTAGSSLLTCYFQRPCDARRQEEKSEMPADPLKHGG